MECTSTARISVHSSHYQGSMTLGMLSHSHSSAAQRDRGCAYAVEQSTLIDNLIETHALDSLNSSENLGKIPIQRFHIPQQISGFSANVFVFALAIRARGLGQHLACLGRLELQSRPRTILYIYIYIYIYIHTHIYIYVYM